MIVKKARLIITNDCLRNCTYCYNKFASITDKAVAINSIYPLKSYDEVMITGGEPMDNPKRTAKIIEVIRAFNPTCKLYLYTARYSVEMIMFLDKLDGVTFSLHEHANYNDLIGFNKFQALAGRFPDKSFRLYMHPKVAVRVPVKPTVWKLVESKPTVLEKDYVLPEGEDLLKLNILLG